MRFCFDFDHFDWVHMFWEIEQTFPDLKATYMVATAGHYLLFSPDALFTNDTEGKYFKVEDRKVKVFKDLHEIRQDCDVDKTKDMSQLTWNGLEWCDEFDEDDEENSWDGLRIYGDY